MVDIKEVKGGFLVDYFGKDFFISHKLFDNAEVKDFKRGVFKGKKPIFYIGEGWIARTDSDKHGDVYLNVRFLNPFMPCGFKRDYNYPHLDYVKLISKFVKLHNFDKGRVL